MTFSDLCQLSIKEQSDGLRTRKFSSIELTTAYLARIKTHDKNLNSFITVCEEEALQSAKVADDELARGNIRSTFHGIPYAHKDIFCTKGIRTTCGSHMLQNFIAPYDATVTEKFAQSGAVLLGKTNMDEFAMGSSNENSYFGPVRNPWDLTRTPGGSSGGSAAVIAARLAPLATGTDTGGSIRQPAAFAGICGIKPTYGLVSRYGMIAFASSLDQGGPMARSAEDLAFALNLMCGFDPRDSTSVQHPAEDYTASLQQPLTGMRIGLPKEYFTHELDPTILELIEQAKTVLSDAGAEFIEINLAHTHYSIPVYYVVAPAEASSNLARYDGVRYGYRCADPKNLEDLYKRSRGEGFGEEVKRRIMMGTYVLSAGFFDAYYLKAQKVRHLIRDEFNAAFNQVDVILAPTTPTTAFRIGEKADDPVSMYLSDIYTVPANLAGLPGLSLPIGFKDGLPVGLQLLGPHFSEARLLQVAQQYQNRTDWHQRQPEGVQ
jgi:aspartyl-tRNA(Asn)/glutamyl-tRNA(Gln) amidotransferase subunit A